MKGGALKRLAARQPNQVILSGPQVQVDQLLQVLSGGYRKTLLANFPVAQGAFSVVLVQHGKAPASDETSALNETLLLAARAAGLTDIRTEPNYTIVAPRGHRGAPFSWEGNPFSWEGNPFSWEGNPFSWEGNPFSWEGNPNEEQNSGSVQAVVTVGATAAEAATLFTAQDAFARIRVTEYGQRNALLANKLGDGVLVGLFDSCPGAEALAVLPGGAPTWLHTHPATTAVGEGPFVDHGLFNASLVNFIAPNAEIHLYQVLNGEMHGETTWLISALASFLNIAEGRPTVTNLSLGAMFEGFTRMPAVEAILSELVRRGGVVCAAAGNQGRPAQKAAAVPHAQMPAALPYVIAVAATNQQSVRASYSQAGDIAAPGGETTGAGPDGVDDPIGLGTASPTGYVRMDCGTSFATPLVAGAAALALSDLLQHGTAPQDANRWQAVFSQLAASAVQPVGAASTLNTTGLGVGILQVTASNG